MVFVLINGTAISSFTSDKDSIYENKPAYNVKISIAGDFVGGKGTSHKDFTIESNFSEADLVC